MEYIEMLIFELDEIIKHFPQGAFVKTQCKSSKNDGCLKPVYNSMNVIEMLIQSKDMINNIKRLYFSSWNYDIEPKNEYRVFIHHGQIVAISQQLWYKNVSNDNSISEYGSSIISWFHNNQKNIPYKDTVMDVYVDDYFKTYLIECNPSGLWSSSGSALFHWIDDYDILHSDGSTVHIRWIKNTTCADSNSSIIRVSSIKLIPE